MITVIGLGFVGLTTALGFCEKGYKVYGVEINDDKRKQLNDGDVPFFEPYLEVKLRQFLNKGFIVTQNLQQAVKESELIIFCVGTPNDVDGNVDLKYLYQSIAETLIYVTEAKYRVLVIKSTIPPSTTKEKIMPFIESKDFKIGKDIGLANNPEFLREGYAWEDFTQPDRIVIGIDIDDKKGKEILKKYYEKFDSPIFFQSTNTAEYIKYLSNTLLSTMISFSNEQSMLAHKLGNIDIASAFKILHLDKRWYGSSNKPADMSKYVYPGCGFGGYCLPKDTKALASLFLKKSIQPQILNSVLETNTKIKEFLFERFNAEVSTNETIGILGLAFKPESDDVRESVAKDFINLLKDKGYNKIKVYDPLATKVFKDTYRLDVTYSTSLDKLLENTDTIIILTAWKEFIKNKDILKQKKLYDFRYYLN
ncbi:nucleotide sugar dehydrogenase [Bacillus sp. RO1]|uniref:nucleotide sugar dehydrogenase n=1 Tax=Bacillus sp. RO1 TaxID=2722703 RepID=UPI00197BD7E3|nr:nucleotide sugar dehydrogenase [Bacillus sp. RO1]